MHHAHCDHKLLAKVSIYGSFKLANRDIFWSFLLLWLLAALVGLWILTQNRCTIGIKLMRTSECYFIFTVYYIRCMLVTFSSYAPDHNHFHTGALVPASVFTWPV